MTRTVAALLVLFSLSIVVYGQADTGELPPDSNYFIGVWRYHLDETFDFVFTITDLEITWERTEPDPALPPFLDYGGTNFISFYTSKSRGYSREFVNWTFSGEAWIYGQGLLEENGPDSDGNNTVKLTLYLDSDIFLGSAGTWTSIILTKDQTNEEPQTD